jgi:hypothetical protein
MSMGGLQIHTWSWPSFAGGFCLQGANIEMLLGLCPTRCRRAAGADGEPPTGNGSKRAVGDRHLKFSIERYPLFITNLRLYDSYKE